MSDNPKIWIITVGAYSDYTVLAAAPTEAEAQEWADAYNAARVSLYRDPAEVEEVEFYRSGDPLPQRVELWHADDKSEWTTEHFTSHPESVEPSAVETFRDRLMAHYYPTREAARAAVDEALGRRS